VSADRVIRTVVGLRPFRAGGFVVRSEKLDDKLVVHDYGHGGGGITLSWGTAHLAAELAASSEHRRCAVIGCGAVGLATARLMQRRGWAVTIYARDLPPETTSNIAGAQWSPASVFDQDAIAPAFRDQLSRAMAYSYRAFQDLVGNRYGVRWVSNYLMDDRPFPQDDLFSRYVHLYPEFRELGPAEHPFSAPYVRHFDTMFIEPPVYLPAIMRDYRLAGGNIAVREFHDRSELARLDEPVIMNCTGLGARALFGDEELIPVKGQLLVLLPQADIDYLTIYRGIYMFPRTDGVLLGGTFERNEWTLTPNAAESARILAGHEAFFHAMDDPWSRRPDHQPL
jgi:glycine/D-amino acid oxidase-like deaminating enzyme